MESGNDYVIQVKGNIRLLHQKLILITQNNAYVDISNSEEKNRERMEYRECKVYVLPDKIEAYESCNTLIYIVNKGIRSGKKYEEHHYYVTNKKKTDASYYMKGIRGHWAIENNCHWVKDAIMYEDKSRVKGMLLAENMSIVRNLVMNVYRLNNQMSIKKAMEKYCNRISESIALISALHIYKK